MWLLQLGQFPFISMTVSRDRIYMRRLKTGEIFDEPPVIAIETKNERRIVKAVGEQAIGLEGFPDIQLYKPFESLEPLFPDFETAAAIITHGVRKVRSRYWMVPKVVLKLVGRLSPISTEEKKILEQLTKRAGVYKLYVFLDRDAVPDDNGFQHKYLVKEAHTVVKGIA